MSDHDELPVHLVGVNMSRHVRCLIIHCARCDLKVLRVERDNRTRTELSPTSGTYRTYRGLRVWADGARNFTEHRPYLRDPSADVSDRTYTWRCARGHADSRKLERFLRAWPQHDPEVGPPARVMHLKLGTDL